MSDAVNLVNFIAVSPSRLLPSIDRTDPVSVNVTESATESVTGSVYRVPKSHEILMFVCLQKDAKQCCDVTKFDHTTSTKSTL